MYHHAKNEVSKLMHSNVITCTETQTDRQTDTQTDRQYENITFPHTRAVIKRGANNNVISCRMKSNNYNIDSWVNLDYW